MFFLGTGEARYARAFRDDFGVPVPILVDTERLTYQALGFERGVRSVLSRSVLRNGLRAFRSGNVQTSTQGDPWQQGGVLVVRAGGEIAFAHASAVAGDHPDVDEVMAALEGACPTG